MIFLRNIALLLMLTFSIWSCSNDQAVSLYSTNEHTSIYLELLGIEHALLISDYDRAIDHSNSLDDLLKDGYNLFCPNQSAKIDGARLTNHILVQHIENKDKEELLDDLRLLKATIINFETDDDYDPYFSFLWRFEEEMYATTQVAIDPMLDLFEWNEFNYMVDCMNEAWQPVKMHIPNQEFLSNDPLKFKNHAVHKITLAQAIENFNKAVRYADNQEYQLCESAEEVRNAYLEYIDTFNKNPLKSDAFLAKL